MKFLKKVVSVHIRIILYVENIKKSFGLKGDKNGYKVKKDILSTQDILIKLFGRGGGGSALLEPIIFKKSPQNPP